MDFMQSRNYLKVNILQRRRPHDDAERIDQHCSFLKDNAFSISDSELCTLVRLSERLVHGHGRRAWTSYHALALSLYLERQSREAVTANLCLKENGATVTIGNRQFRLPLRRDDLTTAAQDKIGDNGRLMMDIANDLTKARAKLLAKKSGAKLVSA